MDDIQKMIENENSNDDSDRCDSCGCLLYIDRDYTLVTTIDGKLEFVDTNIKECNNSECKKYKMTYSI